MKKYAAGILLVLAAIMIYLGVTLGALPPSITGIGFIVIAVVFLRS